MHKNLMTSEVRGRETNDGQTADTAMETQDGVQRERASAVVLYNRVLRPKSRIKISIS